MAQAGLPRKARVVVVFLEGDPDDAAPPLNAEQQAAWRLQSQTSFANDVLLNPAEDCWNHV
jgi:hypothetical protein